MGTFVIIKRQNGNYRYEFSSKKGKTIFISKDFELRFECEENALYLKKNIEVITFVRKKSTNEKLYFTIVVNDIEIAKSRKFTTPLLLQKGIDEIVRTISNSEILDFSIQEFVFPN